MNKQIQNIREKIIRHKTLVSNFGYLSALQVFTMLVPLITLPYLIKVLGTETYGLVVFAQAIISYLVTLTNFGFNISATKEISIHRNNPKKISEILSSVLIIKGVLFILSIFILTIIVNIIPQAKDFKMLFYIMSYMCLYNFIFPTWYFQGIEKMKYITFMTLISKSIFLGSIFVFVKQEEDYLKVPIINAVGSILSGIISLWIIFKKNEIVFVWQPIKKLKFYVIEASPLLFSDISLLFYRATNKVIIGYYIGMESVTYYDVGEKIIYLLKIPIKMTSQSIFPKISQNYDVLFLKKLKRYMLIIMTVIVLIFFISTPFIIKLIFNEVFIEAVKITRILLLSIIFISLMEFYSIFTLLPKGYNNKFGIGMMQATPIYMLCIGGLFLFNILNIYSLSAVMVLIDAYLLFYFYLMSKKLNLL